MGNIFLWPVPDEQTAVEFTLTLIYDQSKCERWGPLHGRQPELRPRLPVLTSFSFTWSLKPKSVPLSEAVLTGSLASASLSLFVLSQNRHVASDSDSNKFQHWNENTHATFFTLNFKMQMCLMKMNGRRVLNNLISIVVL